MYIYLLAHYSSPMTLSPTGIMKYSLLEGWTFFFPFLCLNTIVYLFQVYTKVIQLRTEN